MHQAKCIFKLKREMEKQKCKSVKIKWYQSNGISDCAGFVIMMNGEKKGQNQFRYASK